MIIRIDCQNRKATIMKAFVFSSNSIEDGCFNIILSSKLICI